MLRQEVEIRGEENWPSVSTSLPSKTPQECKKRWNEKKGKGRWSVDEERRLVLWGIVWEGSASQSSEISRYLKGRSAIQTQKKWEKIKGRNLSFNPFTQEEDGMIMGWVEERGAIGWRELAGRMERRSGEQIRRRWVALTNPTKYTHLHKVGHQFPHLFMIFKINRLRL